ncbi:MAG: ABC transporter permease [Propionibacteriaceae bacterium]|jgi:ABC-2 type transport system permease protein|nr:ABC transporter permease [Propionibacteriaceae bacterium]
MKQTIRENISLWLVLTVVQCAMIATIGLTAPIAAAGVAYYNLLPGIFMGIYAIAIGNKLVSAKIDRGTLAYVLSTPVSRRAVVATQALFFAGSLTLMCALTTAVHSVAAMLSSYGADTAEVLIIVRLNLGLLTLALAFSGICFAASCVFNLSKHTIAIGGGLICAFLLAPIIAMFGDNFAFLHNLTIVTLYDVTDIMASAAGWVWRLVALAGIALATYVAGAIVFTRKDLPL